MISSRQDSAVAEISNRDAAAATLNKSQSIEVMPEQNEEKSAANQPVDLESIKDAVRVILKAVGEDPDRDGLLETPRRVAKMYAEMFAGLHKDAGRHLEVTFPETYDEMVLVRDISFTSMCEHHLLPFSGVAHVAYLPDGAVTGLSKLARVVEEVSRRPQVQERMTQTVAELIETRLECRGVAVVVEAEHSCMTIRGIRKPGSKTITSALRGEFKTNPASRAEVMSLINERR
ncbi:GTP cyclohydrolase I FolE [Rubinisphaera brasiliensis]|uniref:GTP cyclohydrolase 1 n=1 Tax=Rubinisphaera brasiliensis (strain ATCC 49424 / DSM 5305 / JCM 21570 / IAM 15109 / NBRC 103401 / IFAM 1448) TaxID=756272 RepID=F0SFP3_RUBBR|nr:GTP cyclohydrolase I [Rubinisphaera brasiliensis DSM 5305]